MYLRILCKYLQNKNIDLMEAVQHINLIKNQLHFIRENVTAEFNKLFIGLNERSNDFKFTIEIPRIAIPAKKKTELIFKLTIPKNILGFLYLYNFLIRLYNK